MNSIKSIPKFAPRVLKTVEALKVIRRDLWKLMRSSRKSSRESLAIKISATIRAALSTPLRNCDIGSVAEQYKRFKKFCFDNMRDGINEPRCSKCPLGKSKSSCKFDWLQMPYEGEV